MLFLLHPFFRDPNRTELARHHFCCLLKVGFLENMFRGERVKKHLLVILAIGLLPFTPNSKADQEYDDYFEAAYGHENSYDTTPSTPSSDPWEGYRDDPYGEFGVGNDGTGFDGTKNHSIGVDPETGELTDSPTSHRNEEVDRWAGHDDGDNNNGYHYRGPAGTSQVNSNQTPEMTLGLKIVSPEEIAEGINTQSEAGPGGGIPTDGESPDPVSDTPSIASVAQSISDFVSDTFSSFKEVPGAGKFVSAVENIVQPIAEVAMGYASNAADGWSTSHVGQATRRASQAVANMNTQGMSQEEVSYRAQQTFMADLADYKSTFRLSDADFPLHTGYFQSVFKSGTLPDHAVSELDFTNPDVNSPIADLLEKVDRSFVEMDPTKRLDIYGPSGYSSNSVFHTPLPESVLSYGITPTAQMGQKYSFSVIGPLGAIHDDFTGPIYDDVPNFVGVNMGVNTPGNGMYISPGGVTFFPDSSSGLSNEVVQETGPEEYHHAGVRAIGHFSAAIVELHKQGRMSFSEEQIKVATQAHELYQTMNEATYRDANGNVVKDQYVHHGMEAAAHTVAKPEHRHVEYVQKLTGLPPEDAVGFTRQIRERGRLINEVYDDFSNHFSDAELSKVQSEYLRQ